MAKKTAAEIVQLPGMQERQEKKERFKRRPDGLYQTEVRYTLPSGEKKRKTIYGKTQTEMLAKKREFETSISAGQNMIDRDVTVAAYARRWLETYKTDVNWKSRNEYKNNTDLLISVLGSRRVRDVLPSDIRLVYNAAGDVSKSKMDKIRITVKAVFRAAVGDRIAISNPAEGVDTPKCDAGTHRQMEDWEIACVLDECKEHAFRPVALLMLFAGLRIGEALAFNPRTDIDWEKKTIHVTRGLTHNGNAAIVGEPKTTASIRTIPLFPPLDVELQRFRDCDFIVEGSAGGYLTDSAYKSMLRSYKSKMEEVINGCSKRWASAEQRGNWKEWTVRCHDMRHTFATMTIEAGADPKSVQKWMGHTTLEMTLRIYTHLSDRLAELSTAAAKKHFLEIASKIASK